MENALLIGLSQQTALRRQMNVIANNLANMNTSGFKSGRLLFEEYVVPDSGTNDSSGTTSQLSFVLDGTLLHDYAEGTMQRTDNPLDVAIGGKGWLVVETADGERYTRNGHMRLNEQGQLVNSAGQMMLGEDGPIVFSPEETGISISKDGTVSTSEGEKGRLKLVEFENESVLQNKGGNLYAASVPPEAAKNVQIYQGMIEKSNVQPVAEMTRMIEVQRAYMRTSSMIEREDSLMRDAINKLGRAPN